MASAREYQWAPSARRYGLHKCDPEATRAFFNGLAARGALTAVEIRDAAKKADNPLHGAAGWHWGDNKTAADKYRLGVANQALSGLRVVYREVVDGEIVSTPVQAYVESDKPTLRSSGGGSYKPIGDVLNDPVERAQLLVQLLHEIRRVERIYATLIAATPEVGRRWVELRTALGRAVEHGDDDLPTA